MEAQGATTPTQNGSDVAFEVEEGNDAERAAGASAEQAEALEAALSGNSLMVFSAANPARQWCFDMSRSKKAEHFILLLIVINTILLVLQSPSRAHDAATLRTFENVETVFNIMYTLELLMKVIAVGLVAGKGTYLRESWNQLDFAIVAGIWLGYFASEEDSGGIAAVRALRALRPLRGLRFFDALPTILGAMRKSVPLVFDVLLMLVFVFIIFGAIGMQLYMGATSRVCGVPGNSSLDALGAPMKVAESCGKVECDLPERCLVVPWTGNVYGDRRDEVELAGFDSIGPAFMAMFVASTHDEWAWLAIPIMESDIPRAWTAWPFYMMVVTIAGVLTMNLFVGVISWMVDNERQAEKEQKAQQDADAEAIGVTSNVLFESNDDEDDAPASPLQTMLSDATEHTMNGDLDSLMHEMDDDFEADGPLSTHKPYIAGFSEKCLAVAQNAQFETLVIAVVLLNTAVLATERYDPDAIEDDSITLVGVLNYMFTLVYLVEFVVKVFSFGYHGYFTGSVLNVLDFTVLFSSILAMIGKAVGLEETMNINALRAFRVVRMLRNAKLITLMSKNPAIAGLMKTVLKSWKAILNVTVFIMIMTCIVALMFMHTLGPSHLNADGSVPDLDDVPRANFFYFSDSILTCFQVMTAEDWAPLLYFYMRLWGWYAAFPILGFFVLGNFFLVNIFIAVILENFIIPEADKERLQVEMYSMALKDKMDGLERLVAAKGLELDDTSPSFSSTAASGEMGNLFRGMKGGMSAVKDKANAAKDIANEKTAKARELAAEKTKGLAEKANAGVGAISSKVGETAALGGFGVDVEAWSNNAKEQLEQANGKSMGFFALDSPTRIKCKEILAMEMFETLVVWVVIASCLALAAEGPPGGYITDYPGFKWFLYVLDCFFFLAFWSEFFIRTIANGFGSKPEGYITDDWNKLDFFILLIASIDVGNLLCGGCVNNVSNSVRGTSGKDGAAWASALRSMRLFRVFRVLRLIRFADIGVIVNAILKGAGTLFAVILVMFFGYVLFGIVGMNLFQGAFYACTDTPNEYRSDTRVAPSGKAFGAMDKIECLKFNESGRADARQLYWENPPQHFDDIWSSVEALFMCTSTEGWVDIMHMAMDVRGPGQAPVRDEAYGHSLFFVIFIIVFVFFVSNMFIGVLCSFFGQSSGFALMTANQRSWVHTQKSMILHFRDTRETSSDHLEGFRLTCFKVTQSAPWEIVVDIVIGLSCVSLLMENIAASANVEDWLRYSNWFFVVFFTLEMAVKMTGLYPRVYWQDVYNRVDAVVVLSSLATAVYPSPMLDGLKAARALRVVRAITLLKRLEGLKNIFDTLMSSLPALVNVLFIQGLVAFTYAIVGMYMYGGIVGETADSPGAVIPLKQLTPLNESNNFRDVIHALMILFQVATGQDLMSLMHTLRIHGGTAVFTYVGSYYIVTVFVVMNLMIAILMQNFEDHFEGQDIELIKEEHILEFNAQWRKLASDSTSMSMPMAQLRTLIESLDPDSPLCKVRTADLFWENRLLHELKLEYGSTQPVNYGELIAALGRMTFSFEVLSFEEQMAMQADLDKRVEQFAGKLIGTSFLFRRAVKALPEDMPEDEREKQIRGMRGLMRWHMITMLHRNKLHGHTSTGGIVGAASLLAADTPKSASSLARQKSIDAAQGK